MRASVRQAIFGQSYLRQNLAFTFDARNGITSSAGLASQWSDQSPFSRHLLQGTGANQPIHLPFDGNKYGWFSGVTGNNISTGSATANRITGDLDLRAFLACPNWAIAQQTIISKASGTTNRSYNFDITTSGVLRLLVSPDGTLANQTLSVSTVATGFAAMTAHWVRATRVASTGKVNFYTSEDGVSWAQLGAADVASTAGNIFDSSASVLVGDGVTGVLLGGRIYRAQIYSGINGALAVDFDPSRWSSGTTFTASTGEVWTINSTGAKPAQIVNYPSILTDGVAQFMAAAGFTLNQPCEIYVVGRQITWTSGDVIFDGATANSGALVQTTGTPQINLNAGSSVAGNTGLALGTRSVICATFNGASSSLQVKSNAATTGDAGAGNMGGLTLGAAPTPANYGNFQFNEIRGFAVPKSDGDRARIINYLMAKWGV